MKFGELILNSTWLSVELIFAKIYPDHVTFLDNYENIYNELKSLKPKNSSITIIIKNVMDEFDNTQYVDVSGYNNSTSSSSGNRFKESLALEFTPWDEWLGMNIDQSSLRNFSSFEIICHCLYEMTFISFSQKKIKNELNKIKSSG